MYKLFWLLDFILRIPFDICVKINKQKFYANNYNRLLALLLWKFKFLEKNELRFVNQIIKKNMNVIDIGSNIGLYTILLANLIGKGGKVFSFEPEPNNFRLLRKSIYANKITNVVPYEIAIGDKKEETYLNVSSINSGDNRLNSNSIYHYKIKAKKDKLDNILLKNSNIDFIKMDIQGGEFLALQGMKNILKQNDNLIVLFEFDTKLIRKANISIHKLIEFLKFYFPFVYAYRLKLLKIEYELLLDEIYEKKIRNIIFARQKINM